MQDLPFLKEIQHNFHLERLASADAVALTLLVHLVQRSPSRWYQGERPDKETQLIIAPPPAFNLCGDAPVADQLFLQIIQSLSKQKPNLLGSVASPKLWNFLYRARLKDLLLSTFTSLFGWKFSNWPLDIYERTLTPIEVLSLQANGRRCVSIFWNETDCQSMITPEKDAFAFTIHDLEHAERFFFDPEASLGQINFYRQLQGDLYNDKWQNRLTQDLIFKKDFEYLLSDMNAHPEHQRQYLQAITYASDQRLTPTHS